MNKLVSIIVPVYGTEAELPACVESLRKQSYENIQIILVDDESPDKCPEICDDFAKKDYRIKVIHQKNKGVSGARNTGLAQAVGEYIMFVDSDDEMRSDAVEIFLADALNYEADIVWAPQKEIVNMGQDYGAFKEGTYTVFQGEEAFVYYLNREHNMNAVWGKIFKADFIKGLSFEEGHNINEDGFFMFLCYMKKPLLVRHDVSVYHYNVRQGSSSRQKFSDKYLSMIYFCEKKKALMKTHYPQYIEQFCNTEILTYLQLLDLLCHTTDKNYKELEKNCVKKVRSLCKGHKPFNRHYAMLACIVSQGLYPFYKKLVRLKYYR